MHLCTQKKICICFFGFLAYDEGWFPNNLRLSFLVEKWYRKENRDICQFIKLFLLCFIKFSLCGSKRTVAAAIHLSLHFTFTRMSSGFYLQFTNSVNQSLCLQVQNLEIPFSSFWDYSSMLDTISSLICVKLMSSLTMPSSIHVHFIAVYTSECYIPFLLFFAEEVTLDFITFCFPVMAGFFHSFFS